MNKKLTSLLLVSSVCLAAGTQAGEDYSKSSGKNVIQQAVQTEPRFYISLSGLGEFDIHATKFISNGGGDIGFAGISSIPIKVQSRDFTATHEPVFGGQLEVGYKLSDVITVFGGFTYNHADGDSHGAGRVSDPGGLFGPAGGVYNLNASVSDYDAYTGRAGIKVTMPHTLLDLIHAPRCITPYFSGSVGGKYVEESHAQFSAGNFLNTRVNLYDDSWVFTTQATLGYDIAFSRNFSVVFESGYGYDTKPERSDSRLRGTSGINDGGDRLYSTVSLGGKFRF